MIGAFWICVFMVLVGIVLYIGELRWRHKHRSDIADGSASDGSGPEGSASKEMSKEASKHATVSQVENTGAETDTDISTNITEGARASIQGGTDVSSEECCGLHLVCEKDSLSPVSDEILYYDDEELDRFVGRAADSYSPEEEEEFRDVLMTLRPEDVSGWARSITQRHLELPPGVRDELLMLVNEQRNRS